MARYKCVVAYDGYNYMGFQIQNELPTIELEINKAFQKLLNEEVKIYPSGRTDRFVHANGQVFHVDLEKDIPPIGLKKGLNSFLPNDIFILDVQIVDDKFHARFSAKKKIYYYLINLGDYNPLSIRYMVNYPNLDVSLMEKASRYLLGKHDFKAFASAQIDKRKSTIKEIYEINFSINNKILRVEFIGDGFLKYQIRRMMGILVQVGKKHFSPKMVEEILKSKNPADSKYILDGCGLYLDHVEY